MIRGALKLRRSVLDKVDGAINEVLRPLQHAWSEICNHKVRCEVEAGRVCLARDVEHLLTNSKPIISTILAGTAPQCCSQAGVFGVAAFFQHGT